MPDLSPREALAVLLAGRGLDGSLTVADAMLAGLGTAGYTLIPTARYEDLDEIRAHAEGRFPRGYVVKAERDQDFYVCWSDSAEAPAWCGTRAEALEAACPESRLRRADETGSSALTVPQFYGWDDDGMVAEQRGVLPRARLRAYAEAHMAGRPEDCWDLLEPFEGETEVRRG